MGTSDAAYPARPTLVFVHGTGGGPWDPDSFGHLQIEKTEEEIDREWQQGELWWQTGGSISRGLADRLTTSDGQNLDDDGVVERFMWSGANLESGREAAARQLAELFQRLSCDGRRLHVLSHSHGGNVVRRAIELARADVETLRAIGSVTSLGTPFFRYSSTRKIWPLAVALLMALVAAGLFGWGFRLGGPLKFLLMGSAAFVAMVVVSKGPNDLGSLVSDIRARHRHRHGWVQPVWRNYFSANDEAIGLLASFNTRVTLLSGGDGLGGTAETMIVLAASVGIAAMGYGMTLGFAGWIGGRIGLPTDVMQWLHLGVGFFLLAILAHGAALAAGGLFVWLAWKAYIAARRGVMIVIDGMITSRLRVLAFGDDVGGIDGVGLHPWPGTEAAAVRLPGAVETAVEAYIAERTRAFGRS